MWFKLEFEQKLNPYLYNDYCRFIFDSMKRDLRERIDRRRYRPRERVILQSKFIQWDRVPPKHLDLPYYVINCLELRRVKGVYVIGLDRSAIIPGSSTRVSWLIRLLEYGAPGFPPLPFVRKIVAYYRRHYKEMFVEFMKERLS